MVCFLAMVIALSGLIAIERFQRTIVQPRVEEKLQAANAMQAGMDVIRNFRVRNLGPVDVEIDPCDSGMLGMSSSAITTNTGSLEAKRTTVNPNWAAVVVDLLHQAGVERGDTIAIGASGSFPALNMAAFVAAETLGLEVVSVVSAGASSWGANIPSLTWIEMEKLLEKAGTLSQRSVAASLGGPGDRAIGMSKSGRRQLRNVIDRNGLEYIQAETDLDSIEQRMLIYRSHGQGRRFKAYVNIGGALASIGPKSIKRIYRPGLNQRLPARAAPVDSVMARFLRDGVPVINLSKVVPLAEAYGMPVEPQLLPRPGEGLAFQRREYNRWLAASVLAGIVISLYGLLKHQFGSRVAALGRAPGNQPLEPMV
jgi:poly-gamma-glutamate system protein